MQPALQWAFKSLTSSRYWDATLHGPSSANWLLIAVQSGQWRSNWDNRYAPPSPFPPESKGVGFCEAPRGSVSHWIKIEDSVIDNYQVVAPTTWNCSPRDDQGRLGAVEQALIGTPVADLENPIEPTRVVRSFDP